MMTMTTKMAFAAVLASALAAPAMAADWQYHGGPKGPDSLSGPSWYDDDYDVQVSPDGYQGGPKGPESGPWNGDDYGPDRGVWYGPRDRYEPTTWDYDNGGRMPRGRR
jgi:hypothetical protein